MQILKKTKLRALELARTKEPIEIIQTLKEKGLRGRGGASFPTGKKWEFAYNTESDEKYVICNADEGEPGTFKDKLILNKNPETLIEGILIASYAINATRAFIYLRGEYEYLEKPLQRTIDKIQKKVRSKTPIEIVVGAGAYVCGDETAIIKSIQGDRGHPYYKPPFPPVEGLWQKPTVINNVETLTNVPQAILFDDWDRNLRLMSVSGNVRKPGVYELPIGTNLIELIDRAKPKNRIKAIYAGCFGGCIPYQNIKLNHDKLCGLNCVIGAFSIIAIDEKQSIIDIAYSISKFYAHESCGKCTPCREGTKRILDIIVDVKKGKAKMQDLHTLRDIAEHIHETSLCGLGQTATNHILNALQYFWNEFEAKVK